MLDILHDIHQYSQNFKISQVITFFERKGVFITRSMIQNYVRDGLLPPPIAKRQYSHKHLAVLALVDALKKVYEMSDIKTVLLPLIDNEGIELDVYRELIRETAALPPPKGLSPLLMMLHSVDVKKEALDRLL